MRIEIIKSKGSWYWRAVAKNNRILCHSEKYKTKRAARKTVDAFLEVAFFEDFKIIELGDK
ncbi:MAG: DUF1508 domain-containing protein [Dongiaceae bacterium]